MFGGKSIDLEFGAGVYIISISVGETKVCIAALSSLPLQNPPPPLRDLMQLCQSC